MQKEESKFSNQLWVEMDCEELHTSKEKRESVNIERRNQTKQANCEFWFAIEAPLQYAELKDSTTLNVGFEWQMHQLRK